MNNYPPGTKVMVKFPVMDTSIPGKLSAGTICKHRPVLSDFDVYVKLGSGDVIPYWYEELQKAD